MSPAKPAALSNFGAKKHSTITRFSEELLTNTTKKAAKEKKRTEKIS